MTKGADQNSRPHVYSPPRLRELDDAELMSALRDGCSDALTVIFERYHRLVFVTALRILGDLGEAEDLMQSVFFEIYQKAEQFNSAKGTLSKWILQYAYHRSINRKNYLTARLFYQQVNSQEIRDETIWTKSSLHTQEATRLVTESLALLNYQQQQIMELVFFEGLSLKEIADQTKQTFASVRHHYYRGLGRLRVCLSAPPATNGKQPIGNLEKVGGANA